jgi:hypothetical protein
MTHDAHLFVLLNVSREVWSQLQLRRWWQWQPPNFLSVTCCREAFPKLEVQGVKGFILVSSLFPLDGGRRREVKKRGKKIEKKLSLERRIFPRLDLLCCLCSRLQLLGAIKG